MSNGRHQVHHAIAKRIVKAFYEYKNKTDEEKEESNGDSEED